MAEFKTFAYIGLVVVGLIAISQFGTLFNISWAIGNVEVTKEIFGFVEPVLENVSDAEVPLVSSLVTVLWYILSLFAVQTPIAIINTVISGSLGFISFLMIFRFLKDRGIA